MLPVTSPTLAHRSGVEPASMVLETMILPLDYRHIRGRAACKPIVQGLAACDAPPSSGVRESNPRLRLGKPPH